jgi:Uncharacterized protein conserved in bacteria
MKISGFDWDDGNWPKCAEHGLSREEVEEVILNEPAVLSDPYPSEARPISARYMHQKEIDHYENKT